MTPRIAIRAARRNNLISDPRTRSVEFADGIKRNRRRNWRVEFISNASRRCRTHGSPYNFRHSFNQTSDHLEKNRRNPRSENM